MSDITYLTELSEWEIDETEIDNEEVYSEYIRKIKYREYDCKFNLIVNIVYDEEDESDHYYFYLDTSIFGKNGKLIANCSVLNGISTGYKVNDNCYQDFVENAIENQLKYLNVNVLINIVDELLQQIDICNVSYWNNNDISYRTTLN